MSSHVGQIGLKAQQQRLLDTVATKGGRIQVQKVGKKGEWLVSLAEDVLLAGEEHDSARLAWLVERVVWRADDLEIALLGDKDAGLADMVEARKHHGRARHEGDANA